MSEQTSQVEEIDLENLVKNLASSDGASELKDSDLDSILFKEAPELAEKQAELRANQIKPDEQVSAEVQDAEGLQTLDQELAPDTFRARLAHRLAFARLKLKHFVLLIRSLFVRGAKDFKGLMIELSIVLKTRFKLWLKAQTENLAQVLKSAAQSSIKQKLTFLLALGLMASAAGLSFAILKNKIHLHGELPWISSLAPGASEVIEASELTETEDFYDPLNYPEFTVIVERIVVNLRTAEGDDAGVLPMAAFEIFLQTESQEAAIEVKNRMVEIRDEVSREAESFTRDGLAEEAGKDRLKTRIRKALNDKLQTGKIRRVFFRTFVLSSSADDSSDEPL